ncbi:uncharacterized protein [Dendrobates tinctorius]|uniref:uncharacterized protein n=1 Tax=Dendrobates tinctorius TaxID=92724 RepID=UPI003CC9ACAE
MECDWQSRQLRDWGYIFTPTRKTEEDESEEEQEETSWGSEDWSVIGCFDSNETLASLSEVPLPEEDESEEETSWGSEDWSVIGCFDSNEMLASLSEVPLPDKDESEEEYTWNSEDFTFSSCFDSNETLASLSEVPLPCFDSNETLASLNEVPLPEEEQEETSWDSEDLSFSICFGSYETISSVSEEPLPSEEEEQAVAMDAIELEMTEEDHSAETTRLPEVKTACADTKPIPCKRKWWIPKCFRRTNRTQVKNISRSDSSKKARRPPKVLRPFLCCFGITTTD